jgi:hypothetical protein
MGRKARSKSERREAVPGKPVASPASVASASARSVVSSRVIAGVVLILVLATVWTAPRSSEDMFTGLAGGRDVFEGKLGKPDDWSFTTAGRVWLNQNWGFDALLYAAFKAGGESGLLAFKALMILAIAAAAVIVARRRGAGWPAALLATAVTMAGTRQYMELRANLATYLMACILLLVLYESHRRPRLVWLAVPLIAVWSDLHGGFTLGLVLLGLWTAAGGADAFRRGGIAAALRWAWPPAAAAAASVVSVVVLSPLGVANLIHPLTVLRSKEWQAVNEWQRVSFASGSATPSAWELVGLAAFLVLATAWRLLAHKGAPEAPGGDGGAPFRLVAFDACLFVLITWMGLSAVRFLPLALVLMTPLAAAQGDLVFRGPRPWLPATIGAAALTAAMLPFAANIAGTYSATNPRFTDESFSVRMLGGDKMPSGAADFLEANDVSGNVLTDWPWEGYLHWRCPKLRLFIGGRAQQIYDLSTFDSYRKFGNDPQPAARLTQWDTHLLVVPLEGKYLHIVDLLAFAQGAHWAIVFFDGRTAVLADLQAPGTRSLAERVAAGHARFRSAPIAELSEKLCAISSDSPVDLESVSKVAAATRAFPTGAGPWFMFFAARAHRLQPRGVILLFETQFENLTRESGQAGHGLGLLQARMTTAEILSNLYRSAGVRPNSEQWAGTVVRLTAEIKSLMGAT